MAKKTETKTEKIEREYTIPLREKCRSVPRYKKANKAIKTIKEFVAKHMKVYDRDLRKIKIDKYLNEMVWFRGIRKPPAKIKVRVVKEGDIVRVEAVDMLNNIKFKKAKEEKREKEALEIGEKKKPEEKPEEARKEDEEKKEGEEKKEEEKEKKAAVVEAGKQIEKAAARQAKHMKGGKTKEPKHQRRMALQK